jgi:hypothetical protein
MMLFRRGDRKKSTQRTPLIWRTQAPDQGSTVDLILFPVNDGDYFEGQ